MLDLSDDAQTLGIMSLNHIKGVQVRKSQSVSLNTLI